MKLRRSVIVGGVAYPKGTELPDEVAARVRNPHAFEPTDQPPAVPAGQVDTESAETAAGGGPAGSPVPHGGPETRRPAGNASESAWRDYAISRGWLPEELDGMTRNQIRAQFPE